MFKYENIFTVTKSYLKQVETESRKKLPLEIIDMIIDKVKEFQDSELKMLIPQENTQNSENSPINHMSSLLYFVNSIDNTLGVIVYMIEIRTSKSKNEVWLAVFSKDVFIFSLLILFQISFPIWLYHL